MEATFYCTECGTELDPADVEQHETQGHTVEGAVRPDRLLSQDPWERTGATEEE